MRNISDKTVEEIKTHVSRSVTLFFLRKSCLYETMWKNTVEPDRSQIKIWRVRVACWIAKATHKHTQKKKIYIYNTDCFSATTMVTFTPKFPVCLDIISGVLEVSVLLAPGAALLWRHVSVLPRKKYYFLETLSTNRPSDATPYPTRKTISSNGAILPRF